MTHGWPRAELERLADAVPPMAADDLGALARTAASEPRRPPRRRGARRGRVAAASAAFAAAASVGAVLAFSLPHGDGAAPRSDDATGSALVRFPAGDAIALLVGRRER